MIAPRLENLLERAVTTGEIPTSDILAAVDLYLGVLIGDLKIRRVIGALPHPNDAEITRRNMRAIRALATLPSDV